MNSLIKSSLLPDSGVHDEYLIEHAKDPTVCEQVVSPEDAARAIIAQAEADAQALASEAAAEAESIRSSAYNEGYERGLRQLDETRQEVAAQIGRIEADAAEEIERFWTSIEPELLKLSVEIAGKIVRHHIDDTDGFVLTTVKEGIRQLRDRQDLKIRVNPEDYNLMREHKEDAASSCDGIKNLEIIDDRRVDAGGCIIESGNGDLDARIETQLSEAEKALLEASRYGRSEDPTEP